MWKLILRSPQFWSAVALIAVAIFSGGWYYGHDYADNQWQAKRATALEDAQAEKRAAEKRARTFEQKYLTARSERRVVYRERIREVPKYIDRDNCRVNPVGMQQLACALDPARCASEPAAALSSTADTGRP